MKRSYTADLPMRNTRHFSVILSGTRVGCGQDSQEPTTPVGPRNNIETPYAASVEKEVKGPDMCDPCGWVGRVLWGS